MEEIAYAKINLALHVRGRRSDGCHDIETIFAFCEEGDRLGVTESDRLTLCVTGQFAAGLPGDEGNLALLAARRLAERYGVARGAALILDKRLPVAAGLGGGSADAAAALRLLARWWSLSAAEPDLLEIAASLGADVPACLVGRTLRGSGKGDRLEPLSLDLAGMPVLLVNPGVPLSTAAVFAAWNGADAGALGEDFAAGRNDLQPAAAALVPEIAAILSALSGASLARMSGSGATCFGLFPSERARDDIAERIRAAYPHWWQLRTRLR